MIYYISEHIPDHILNLHLFFRSRGVASVTTKASFTPDKINIFNKDCDIFGRKLACFNTHLCFSAAFRPKNPVGPIGKYDDLSGFSRVC